MEFSSPRLESIQPEKCELIMHDLINCSRMTAGSPERRTRNRIIRFYIIIIEIIRLSKQMNYKENISNSTCIIAVRT